MHEPKEARTYILDEVMAKLSLNRDLKLANMRRRLNRFILIRRRSVMWLAKRGKVINQIIEETGVKIDITDDGAVSVCGIDRENIKNAINLINIIVTDYGR